MMDSIIWNKRDGIGYKKLHGFGVGGGDLERCELSAEIQEMIYVYNECNKENGNLTNP